MVLKIVLCSLLYSQVLVDSTRKMKVLVVAVSLLLVCTFIIQGTSGQYCNGPKRGYIYDTSASPGSTPNIDDYITVGLLFPFHSSSADGTTCSSDIPNPDTIQILEMARYTLWFQGIAGVRVGT